MGELSHSPACDTEHGGALGHGQSLGAQMAHGCPGGCGGLFLGGGSLGGATACVHGLRVTVDLGDDSNGPVAVIGVRIVEVEVVADLPLGLVECLGLGAVVVVDVEFPSAALADGFHCHGLAHLVALSSSILALVAADSARERSRARAHMLGFLSLLCSGSLGVLMMMSLLLSRHHWRCLPKYSTDSSGCCVCARNDSYWKSRDPRSEELPEVALRPQRADRAEGRTMST